MIIDVEMRKEATAILTADIHLRDDIPVCRTDDFILTQAKKLDFISALQKQHSCPVLMAGDIFHKWKASPYLLAFAIEHFPKNSIAIAGQHDLPQHNFSNFDKSGLHVLEKAEIVKVLYNDDYQY